MKLIFLDIDGVLNHQAFYTRVTMEERIESRRYLNDEWGEVFCEQSTMWLNKLIDETGAKVVVSSSKRHVSGKLPMIQDMWKNRGFTGEVIGITPHLYLNDYGSLPRGCEIEMYLEKVLGFRHCFWSREYQEDYIKKSGVENYVILDDDSDMLYTQRRHFVHIPPPPRHYSGFDSKYYLQAKEVLMSSVMTLNFE